MLIRLADIFLRRAQALPDAPESGIGVQQKDKDAFVQHTNKALESSTVVNDWVQENVGLSADQKLLELKRFSGALLTACENLKTVVQQYIVDSSQNKTIQTVEPKVQLVVQNYNALRPTHITEDWMQRYAVSDEAKAMNQIRDSIKYIQSFITKQKNAENNRGSTPPLP